MEIGTMTGSYGKSVNGWDELWIVIFWDGKFWPINAVRRSYIAAGCIDENE